MCMYEFSELSERVESYMFNIDFFDMKVNLCVQVYA